jgi:hypothetical protein
VPRVRTREDADPETPDGYQVARVDLDARADPLVGVGVTDEEVHTMTT